MASSPNSLKGKVVLITGASSGIGKETAVHFAALGARLAITGRKLTALQETESLCKSASSPDVLVIAGDLTVESDCERIVKETIDHFHELHVLINNAGFAPYDSILNITLKTFDETMNVNLRSVVHLTSLCVPHLIQTKGAIVNVSTALALRPPAGMLSYAVAKAGLDHFTKCTAVELAPKQVRVNSVNPGVIDTPLHGSDKEQVKAFLGAAKSFHALGRVGQTSEVAQAIAFLASDQAGFVTGAIFPVDGGLSIKPPF